MSKHLSLFSEFVNLQKRPIRASQYQDFSLIIIQKWRWFVRVWLKTGHLTRWRGWGSEIAAAGKVIRRVWSQETPSGCYRLCQLCCLSSGISHSLQMSGSTKRWWWWWWWCRNRTWTYRGRQEGRQAGNDPSPSQPSQPRQDRRQEWDRATNCECMHIAFPHRHWGQFKCCLDWRVSE